MAEAHKMDVIISAQDRASAKLKQISGNMGVLNRQGMAAGATFALMNQGMMLITSSIQKVNQRITDGIQMWYAFEDQLAEINTMLDDTEKKYLPDMEKGIEDLAVKWGKSTTDMARGMYETLSASVDAGRAIEFLGTASKVATAGLATVEEAVDVLTTVLNAYGMQASAADHISDILFKTIKEGKLRFNELSYSLGYVVPIAAAAGISFEEVAAAIATMTKQGISAQKASRGLRTFISALISPTEEASDAAYDYGVFLDGLHLQVVGLTGVLDEMQAGLGGNNVALANMFSNVQQLSVVLALMNNEGKIFDNTFTEIMEGSSGAASKAALEVIESGGFYAKALQTIKDEQSKAIGESQAGRTEDITLYTEKWLHGLGGFARAVEGVLSFGVLWEDASEGMAYHTEQIQKLDKTQGDVKETQRELTEEFKNTIKVYAEEGTYIDRNVTSIEQFIKADAMLKGEINATNEELEAAVISIGDLSEVWNVATDEINTQASAFADWQAKEILLVDALNDLDYNIVKVTQRIADLSIIRDIENDLYKASMAMEGVAVAGEYTDHHLSNLIGTLLSYEVQLESLNDTQKGFSREQKLINIALLELELGTSVRGRKGRDYKKKVDDLKREQKEIRLQEMKGGLEIQDFKDQFYDGAVDSYNKYILSQQVEMRRLAGVRDEELESLERSLEKMKNARVTYFEDLKFVLQKELNLMGEYYGNLISMKNAYETSGVVAPQGLTTQIENVSNPRGLLNNNVHVDPITITVNTKGDANTITQIIQQAISAGLLSGDISTVYG